MGYCVQFLKRCSHRRNYDRKGLTTADLKQAEEALCRLAQRDCFQEELKSLQRKEPVYASSKLKRLHSQLGVDEIIRVDGRLENSSLHTEAKHPLIIPGNHPLATLLMKYYNL